MIISLFIEETPRLATTWRRAGVRRLSWQDERQHQQAREERDP
jgi:hypothetical protein